MSAQVISLACIKVQLAIELFTKTSVISDDLLHGVLCVQDITDCLPDLNPDMQEAAHQLISKYTLIQRKNIKKVKAQLHADYLNCMENLHTNADHFRIPEMLLRYRHNINPVKAMYYEVREMVGSKGKPNNQCYSWLKTRITDEHFNATLLNAIQADLVVLERFVKKYYWTVTRLDQSAIPLEIFHAKQMVQDFKHYLKVYTWMLDWHPGKRADWI